MIFSNRGASLHNGRGEICKIQTVPTGSGGLEIPVVVEVNVHWEDKRALEMLKRKTKVSYPLGETQDYQNNSKDILNSILKEKALSKIALYSIK